MGIYLKVLGGCLCVCATTYTLYCEAWTVEGNGTRASWTRLFKFSSDPLSGCKYWLEVLWVSKNGNVLFNLDGWELVLYNPEEQTLKQYRVPNDGDWFLATTYMKTLVSPNAPEGSIME
ncbi:hypothetical protein JCGZ_13606 [Jatropha curcas]|uniref:F-box associated domain-containing protein n=2 Tax=Jatropha curcas TaxID=180498 RepID=A0A067KMN1_JATCU|nr:hypothetical protein JCGZ_13606 [Jatropha curcas]